MSAMILRIKEFVRSEDGPTTVEYAVMLALIVAVAIAAILTLGGKVKSTFESVNAQIP